MPIYEKLEITLICTYEKTDMGKIDSEVALHLKGSDLILLESNHDKKMLTDGPYPSFLKRSSFCGVHSVYWNVICTFSKRAV